MNYTKCIGKPLALEYNEKYIDNVKLACYCEHCCMTTKRESTPYKIIQTDNGYIEIRNDDHVSDDEEDEEEKQDPTDAYDYEEGQNEDC